MHLFLQMSKLQETTSYFDENAGRVGVKSDTVGWFLQNLGKEAVRTNMHTTVLVFLNAYQ